MRFNLSALTARFCLPGTTAVANWFKEKSFGLFYISIILTVFLQGFVFAKEI